MDRESIFYILEAFGIKEKKYESFQAADRILLMDENVLDEASALYICMDPLLELSFEKSLIVSIGSCRVRAKNYVELETGTVASVFNALMEPERNLKMLAELLKDLGTAQDVIDIASNYLGSPFFYFDESYRVLAITKGRPSKEDPEWDYMTEQRFLSPESIRLMQDSGDLELLAKEKGPVVYDASFFPFISIVTNIDYNGVPYARLNRLCVDGKVTPISLEECRIIAGVLGRMLTMNNTASSKGPVDNMLRDILNGAQLPEELIRNRLMNVYPMKGDQFRICVIDVKHGSDNHVPSYYSMLLKELFKTKECPVLIHEENIVLVLPFKADDDTEAALSELLTFLVRQNLRAGLSDPFTKFSLLKNNYEQAFAALFFAGPSQLIVFRDIIIDHLLSMIPDDRRDVFTPFELRKLEDAADQFSFDMKETLRVYLECNCSLQKSAEKLFLHKNTMLYRINKIKSIINSDLEDPYQRFILMLSLHRR